MKSRRNVQYALVVFIMAALWIFPASQAFATTAGEITQGLTCTCGCNMLVSAYVRAPWSVLPRRTLPMKLSSC